MAERFSICDDPEIFVDGVTNAQYKITMVVPPLKPKDKPVDPDSLVEFLVSELNTNKSKFT